MTRSTIFTVHQSGKLTAMRPAAPESEECMQEMVAAHPELIADEDGDLLLISRELPISDQDEGAARWSLDHLFVTRTGIPVLVELKRAVDTRLRREVVGQMLDYAANANVYWKAGAVAQTFAATAREQQLDPDDALSAFLAGTTSAEEFWQQVDANFAAGRIKLVFVADRIPRELARIVEFLNEQMRATVRAVELSWFEDGAGTTALTPRVIGMTERARATRSARYGLQAVSPEQWVEARMAPLGEAAINASHHFIELVGAAGGQVVVPSTQGSINSLLEGPDGVLYPLRLAPEKSGLVQLNLGDLSSRPAFADAEVRRRLYSRLQELVGPLTTENLAGFPGFDARLLNDSSIREGLAAFLAYVSELARAGPR